MENKRHKKNFFVGSKVADATNLQLQVKKLRKILCAADVLAATPSGLDSGDVPTYDAEGVQVRDFEPKKRYMLTLSFQHEKEGIVTALKIVQEQLDLILDDLSRYPEIFRSELEGFYAPADSRRLYVEAEKLIDWTEGTRKHLIEIPGKTQILLKEKEERKLRVEEECLYLQRLLSEMKTLKTRVQLMENALHESKQLKGYGASNLSLWPKALPSPGMPHGTPSSELMQVDDDCLGRRDKSFSDLEQVRPIFPPISCTSNNTECADYVSSTPTYAHFEILAFQT